MMTFDLSAQLSALRRTVRPANGGMADAVILTHDNPDPDSLAAGLGMKGLLEREGFRAVMALGGIIGRAENRAMVRELKIDLQPVELLDLERFPLVALVDTQPGTGNNSLPEGRRADIVIDHHPTRPDGPSPDGIAWRDVRPEVGATATIVHSYLKEARVPIDPLLATAFLYALKSETRDLSREAGPEERAAYVDLMPLADFEKLHAISNPKLGREHFVAVDRALRSATCWGELLAVNLGALDFPDLVAEVADLMLPYEKARWVVCVGQHSQKVYLSVRTDIATATAGALIRRVVGPRGASGGHGLIAGGRLFAEVRDEAALKAVYDDLIARFLAELHISATPAPLI
jgi:nanoRNase/pAp phosphatase (c-di-AMP/oligoRNAs hydrolase)